MARQHKQRPSATWFAGRSPRSRVLLGCAVAVSLLLASRFGVSIALRFGASVALLGFSVLILCGAVGAGLRFLWSEEVHRLPRRVEGVLVGAVVLAVLAGLVPVLEEPQSSLTGPDATGPTSGGPTSGRPNREVPGSAGVVPPGDASDHGPRSKGVRPDSARGDSDPFTLSIRMAAATGSEAMAGVRGLEPNFLSSTVSADAGVTTTSARLDSLTSTPLAGRLPADEMVPDSTGRAMIRTCGWPCGRGDASGRTFPRMI